MYCALGFILTAHGSQQSLIVRYILQCIVGNFNQPSRNTPFPPNQNLFTSLKAAQSLHSFIGPEPRACPVILKNALLVSRS